MPKKIITIGAVSLPILLCACDPGCQHIEEYHFSSRASEIEFGQNKALEFVFYPASPTKMSFPEDIREALDIEDGEQLIASSNPSKIIRREYSSDNPLVMRLVVSASRDVDGTKISVEGVGSYSGPLDRLSLTLYRQDTCPLPLDSDPYFISAPILFN